MGRYLGHGKQVRYRKEGSYKDVDGRMHWEWNLILTPSTSVVILVSRLTSCVTYGMSYFNVTMINVLCNSANGPQI